MIEGLEDGRFAFYLKIHHSMVDGVSGMRMLVEAMSDDPEASKKLPPMWEVVRPKSHAQPLPVPTPAAGYVSAFRSLVRERKFMPLVRELRGAIKDFREEHPALVVGGQAPRSLFNQKVSATRRFAAQSYSMPRIRAVAGAYSATVNDVVLAMCGGALRRYLAEMNELPEKSLVAAVPVSTRKRGDKGMGNEVSFTMTYLATDCDDPAERLRIIKGCMDYNKQRMQKLSPGQLMTFAALMLMPGAVNELVGFRKDRTLGNVVISHVPGPRQDMYWQGAKLTGIYPASLLIDQGNLNITLVSRHDYIDFGLIACRKAVPHMQRLLGYLEDALVELETTIK